MDLNLTGRRAIVCGSSRGLGLASAQELALLGADVTLIARDETKLKEALSTLAARPNQSHDFLVADFTYPDRLRKLLSDFTASGRVAQVLINNTGGPGGGPILHAQSEEFTQAFSNHLVCNHLLVQALVPGMKAAKFGRIINIISTSVKQPLKNLGVSNTIRAAVANWSKTLAGELAPFGITVNNVLPGFTKTVRAEYIIASKMKETGKSEDDVVKDFVAEIPAGRIGSPADFGAAVAFLCSPSAGYITGINLPVDGGRTGCL